MIGINWVFKREGGEGLLTNTNSVIFTHFEVFMLQSLFSGDSLFGVVCEEPVK